MKPRKVSRKSFRREGTSEPRSRHAVSPHESRGSATHSRFRETLPRPSRAGASSPLPMLGTFLLGLGIAGRLLVPETAGPVPSVAPTVLLLMGSGVVFLHHAMRGRVPHPLVLLLPLALLGGFFPLEARTVARGFDDLAVLAAGLACALWGRSERAFGRTLRRALVALGVFLCVLALAQSLYQRAEVAEVVNALADAPGAGGISAPFLGDAARAFASSRRAAATFTNANVFAGFLLLLLPLFLLEALGAATRRRILSSALALGLLWTAAFLSAASAGATLALFLSAGVLHRALGRVGPEPDGRAAWPRRLRRPAAFLCALGLLALVLLVFSLLFGWEPPLLAAKVGTFRLRLDYHLQAFRLLPAMGWTGIGFESFGPLALGVMKPGESWSHHLHDWPLQLLLAAGPLVLLLALPVIQGWRCLARNLRPASGPPLAGPESGAGGLAHSPVSAARAVTPPPAPSPTCRAFLAGVLLAGLLAPLITSFPTLMPLDSPLADSWLFTALTTTLLLGLSLIFLRRLAIPSPAASRTRTPTPPLEKESRALPETPASRSSAASADLPAPSPSSPGFASALLLTGLAAFLLHAPLDFDLQVPAAALVFSLYLALVACRVPHTKASRHRWGALSRPLALGLALVLLVLPIPAARLALKRDLVSLALRNPSKAPPDLFLEAVRSRPPDLRALEPALVHLIDSLKASEADALIASLHPLLRARPTTRLAIANALVHRALQGATFTPEALRRLDALLLPDSPLTPHILHARLRLLAATHDPRTPATARRLLAAARRWHLDDGSFPFLQEARRLSHH